MTALIVCMGLIATVAVVATIGWVAMVGINRRWDDKENAGGVGAAAAKRGGA